MELSFWGFVLLILAFSHGMDLYKVASADSGHVVRNSMRHMLLLRTLDRLDIPVWLPAPFIGAGLILEFRGSVYLTLFMLFLTIAATLTGMRAQRILSAMPRDDSGQSSRPAQ